MKTYFLILSIALSQLANAQVNQFLESVSYLRTNAMAPTDYVLSKVSKYDVVLLGEDHAVKDNLDLVKRVIPDLYRRGVTNLGMEFGSMEMQARIDSLMIAPSYNEQVVRNVMYFHNVAWPCSDYLAIYRTVWEFNHSLPEDQKKFRVLHLSYQYDWKDFEGEMTPEKRKKVFHRGGDKFWSDRVKQEVISRGEKILCLVGVPHAFTRFHQGYSNEGSCRYDSTQFGQYLYKEYPNKVFSIFMHSPLPAKWGSRKQYAGAGDGIIDQILHNLGNKPSGFDLVGTPAGDVSDGSLFSSCHDGFKLKDFFDGYIFIKPYHELKGASFDPDFYTNRSWKEILNRQPDPNWFKADTEDQLRKKMSDYADLSIRYKDVNYPQLPKVTRGFIQRLTDFPSQFVAPRNVDIWQPANYSPKNKYAVLYMHDGQMLYDSATTWNKSAWDVDDVATQLLNDKKIRNVIVVGIWNNGAMRHVEYFPRKPFELLSKHQQDSLFDVGRSSGGSAFATPNIESDNYLKFLVTELKPFVDKNYSTLPDQSNTFVAGSSMGGLISLYAICEYPSIFGGAACLSTHWPGVFADKNNPIPNAFYQYLKSSLPDHKSHKIYFDYGDQTLDALYPPLQKQVDLIMKNKGFTKKNWLTKFFAGDDHSEIAWKRRLNEPMVFLLGKE